MFCSCSSLTTYIHAKTDARSSFAVGASQTEMEAALLVTPKISLLSRQPTEMKSV